MTQLSPSPRRPASRLARWLMAAAGLASFAVGGVGVFVPVLPTTVFVILGSYLLTRSCPWIEERLLETRLFKPFARYLDPSVPLPDTARRRALTAMWLSILAAMALLWSKSTAPGILLALGAAGLVGTLVVLRFRRGTAQSQSEEPLSL